MNPQTDRIELPQGYELSRRATCQPNYVDEPMMVRTDDGHVMATIEAWVPERDAVN